MTSCFLSSAVSESARDMSMKFRMRCNPDSYEISHRKCSSEPVFIGLDNVKTFSIASNKQTMYYLSVSEKFRHEWEASPVVVC